MEDAGNDRVTLWLCAEPKQAELACFALNLERSDCATTHIGRIEQPLEFAS